MREFFVGTDTVISLSTGTARLLYSKLLHLNDKSYPTTLPDEVRGFLMRRKITAGCGSDAIDLRSLAAPLDEPAHRHALALRVGAIVEQLLSPEATRFHPELMHAPLVHASFTACVLEIHRLLCNSLASASLPPLRLYPSQKQRERVEMEILRLRFRSIALEEIFALQAELPSRVRRWKIIRRMVAVANGSEMPSAHSEAPDSACSFEETAVEEPVALQQAHA